DTDKLIALPLVFPVRLIVPVPTAIVAPDADKLITLATVPLTLSVCPLSVRILLVVIAKELRLAVSTSRVGALAPAAPMTTSSPVVGTPLGDQFPLVFQLGLPPCQVLVASTSADAAMPAAVSGGSAAGR